VLVVEEHLETDDNGRWAAVTFLTSSRVLSRTSTFVSTDRTAPLDMPPDAFFHVGHDSSGGRCREQRAVNLL
jgi:hypothetical protein